jgi:hypothetical protein
MLISMPTGTSTIFGVFQAIWRSFLGPGDFSPTGHKLLRNEKFASEIFGRRIAALLVATHKDITFLCEHTPKQRGINGFKVGRDTLDAVFTPNRWRASDKEPVKCPGLAGARNRK